MSYEPFYKTAVNANASVNTCCSHSNAYQQDPVTSAIQTPGQDGSYAMFVRMPDLAVGESSDFTICYHIPGATSLVSSAYRKYGPVPPGGPSATWYTLPGVVYGTANVRGTMVATASFTLADNVLGDDTGVIVDQGGPGFPGAARPIPTLSNLVVLLLALLVGVVAVGSIRRVTH
ncbi:MAG: hypothetical protein AB2699_11950 [Candidatus Thiodiazotropha taylori]